jgi:protease I
MNKTLAGKTIAIIATDGFEEAELFETREALLDAGAAVSLLSPKSGEIRAWKEAEWSDRTITVDEALGNADPDKFDGLLLPGGVVNADRIRTEEGAVRFVLGMVDAGKPIAVICHGSWVLIEAEAVDERIMTSWPSLRTDLENAGARWVDEEVVVDGGLVSSRKPDDIPSFNSKMIEEFSAERVRPGSGRTRAA